MTKEEEILYHVYLDLQLSKDVIWYLCQKNVH